MSAPDYHWKKAHAEHQTWIAYLQPTGLVIAPKALTDAMVPPVREGIPEAQDALDELIARGEEDGAFPWEAAFTALLGWQPGMWRTDGLDDFAEPLPEYHEILRPTAYVPAREPGEPPRLLIQQHPGESDFNADAFEPGGWETSPRVKFERLLRSTKVPAGVLLNDRVLRLVVAPEGETSGYMDFRLADMTTVAGRPILDFPRFHGHLPRYNGDERMSACRRNVASSRMSTRPRSSGYAAPATEVLRRSHGTLVSTNRQ
jgi:hypothetical protein